jgi:signal transduction histidine kinase
MRIRTTVKLIPLLTMSLMVLYGAFTAFFNLTLEAKFHELRTSSQIRILFDQLQDTTSDYLLYPAERAEQQWRILYAQVLHVLNEKEHLAFQRLYETGVLSDKMQLMEEAFKKLTVTVKETGLSQDAAQKEFQSRLITQITLTAREIGTAFDKISENIEGEVLSLQRWATFVNIVGLVLVASFVFWISSFMSKSVVQPVLKLHEGAEIIGRGDLDFRIDPTGSGEIRELSHGLNQMTANLSNLKAALQKSHEHLRDLASQLIVAQEKERQYLGLELHDDFGQLLMVLKMQLREVQRNLEPESIMKSKTDLENSLNLINEIVDRIRRLSRSLRPSVLEHMGLSTGLKLLFEDFQKYHGFEMRVEMDNVDKTFSWEHQILIYRIFQESLTNVAKHSGAAGVTISIEQQDGQVAFQMQDNGKGFDLQGVHENGNKSRGLGLAAIEERVRMMGGDLELNSQPGKGTRIQFTVPVDNPKV